MPEYHLRRYYFHYLLTQCKYTKLQNLCRDHKAKNLEPKTNSYSGKIYLFPKKKKKKPAGCRSQREIGDRRWVIPLSKNSWHDLCFCFFNLVKNAELSVKISSVVCRRRKHFQGLDHSFFSSCMPMIPYRLGMTYHLSPSAQTTFFLKQVYI